MGVNWIWLIFLIIVIVLDISTSAFTFSWLGVGFVVAFIAGFYVDFQIQIVLAAVIGTISILVGLKITKKYVTRKLPEEKLLVGKFVGRQFIADFSLKAEDECRIKVNEVYWTAHNNGEDIKAGDKYTILEIAENKLIIKKL